MLLNLSSCFTGQDFEIKSTNSNDWVFPVSNSKLTSTHVLFEFEAYLNANKYELQIALDQNKFEESIIHKETTEQASYLAKDGLLSFGGTYYWKVIYKRADTIIHTGEISTFSIVEAPFLFAAQQAIKIKINDPNNHSGGYIFIDAYGVLINRAGKIVWYHPFYNLKKKLLEGKPQKEKFRNLRLQNDGNIMFFNKHERFPKMALRIYSEVYHTTIDGQLIWKGPDSGEISGKNLEHYHHDFMWLKNGNYMLMGQKKYPMLKPNTKDTIQSDRLTLIEYNPAGEVVWSWNSMEEYFKRELYKDGTLSKKDPTHPNAFYYDEENDMIYISYRHINQILKLKKSTKEVLDTYGEKRKYKGARTGDGLFYAQHAPKLVDDKTNMLLFNNISPSTKAKGLYSKITKVSLPKDTTSEMEKVWEYELKDFNDKELDITHSFGMGNVEEQINGNVLACLGHIPSIVEVKDTAIVWRCDYAKDSYRSSWAKNLYPCKFTAEFEYIDKDTVVLRLKNIGWKEDSYTIDFGGQKFDVSLAAGEDKKIDLGLEKQKKTQPLSIASKTNKSYTKEYTIKCP